MRYIEDVIWFILQVVQKNLAELNPCRCMIHARLRPPLDDRERIYTRGDEIDSLDVLEYVGAEYSTYDRKDAGSKKLEGF
jgi:hypothetical protein